MSQLMEVRSMPMTSLQADLLLILIIGENSHYLQQVCVNSYFCY